MPGPWKRGTSRWWQTKAHGTERDAAHCDRGLWRWTAGLLAGRGGWAAELSTEQVRAVLGAGSPSKPADLAGKDLSDLDLSGLDFRGANLRGVSFFGSKLVQANMRGAKLEGANLNGAWLMGTDFTGADLDPPQPAHGGHAGRIGPRRCPAQRRQHDVASR